MKKIPIGFILALLLIPFAVMPVAAQSIMAYPDHGLPGDTLTIRGYGLDEGGIEFYYPDRATRIDWFSTDMSGDFSRFFTIPLDAPGGTNELYIRQIKDNLWYTCTFTVDVTITFGSTSGHVGDQVSYTSRGFKPGSTVTIYFDDEEAGTTISDTNGNISDSFVVPPSAYGSHTVEARAIGAASYGTTTFLTKARLISINPASGPAGSSVTVRGNGFKADKDIDIYFAGVAISIITSDSKGSVSGGFTVPAIQTGTHKVKVTDGTSTCELDFTLASKLTVTPSMGNIGTQVVASGTSFIIGGTVTVIYDNEVVTTTTTDSKGSFSVTFEVPVSEGGMHVVQATDGTNTLSCNFTMETKAPATPSPLAPYMGTKQEQPISFDWEDVEDPSGVTYTLQIARDPNFSYVVLEKAGLKTSGYTLTGYEKLESAKKEAPYHWRARAVDGASNESDWTTAGSFYTGFTFAGWALYLVWGLSCVVALAIGFWLGRKAVY